MDVLNILRLYYYKNHPLQFSIQDTILVLPVSIPKPVCGVQTKPNIPKRLRDYIERVLMANADVLIFNIGVFVCALFLLEAGADKFIDHTAVVGKRIGVSPSVIGLLTAGAEWEELAVVIVSIARGRSSLAMGNIIGSAISNILGAFSLGLLFYKSTLGVSFDKSSKIYTSTLLIITILVAGLTGFTSHRGWRAIGGVLIGIFALYVGSVAWTITRGILTAPEELSDSDSDDDVSSSVRDSRHERTNNTPGAMPDVNTTETTHSSHPHFTKIYRDLLMIFIGFLCIILSSYLISHAATNIIDELAISDVLFGVVILSIATTLPEKFIATMSGIRGHPGILVANTVGSNIFLLTLCMGILLVSTNGVFDAGTVNPAELGILLASSVVLSLTVWFPTRFARWIGGLMAVGYVAFIILEFTTIRKVHVA